MIWNKTTNLYNAQFGPFSSRTLLGFERPLTLALIRFLFWQPRDGSRITSGLYCVFSNCLYRPSVITSLQLPRSLSVVRYKKPLVFARSCFSPSSESFQYLPYLPTFTRNLSARPYQANQALLFSPLTHIRHCEPLASRGRSCRLTI